jgi:general secretion pathway protein D
VDVGLKLEVEPRVTLDDHVNIKVALEVASIARTITTKNGGLVYQIGTRNASTMLRLKDSETQVLAGLISDEERETGNKLPGLGDIPLLGRLFSTQKDEKNKTEILLAITPRILNNISRPQAEIQEYWSGTESGITDRPQIIAPGAGGGSGPQRALPVRPQIPARPNPPPETPSASPEGTPAPEATPAPPAENAANVESTPAATAPASP